MTGVEDLASPVPPSLWEGPVPGRSSPVSLHPRRAAGTSRWPARIWRPTWSTWSSWRPARHANWRPRSSSAICAGPKRALAPGIPMTDISTWLIRNTAWSFSSTSWVKSRGSTSLRRWPAGAWPSRLTGNSWPTRPCLSGRAPGRCGSPRRTGPLPGRYWLTRTASRWYPGRRTRHRYCSSSRAGSCGLSIATGNPALFGRVAHRRLGLPGPQWSPDGGLIAYAEEVRPPEKREGELGPGMEFQHASTYLVDAHTGSGGRSPSGMRWATSIRPGLRMAARWPSSPGGAERSRCGWWPPRAARRGR